MKTNSLLGEWFADAKTAGWCGLDEIYRTAKIVHGKIDIDSPSGFWRCDCCETPVLDPAVGEEGCGAAVLLDDQSGIGCVCLCDECYAAAKAARAKIVVFDDEEYGECEDDANLTEEEKELARYLEYAAEGRARQSRELIASYPRSERRQLHRYQDEIDAENHRRGKAY